VAEIKVSDLYFSQNENHFKSFEVKSEEMRITVEEKEEI